MSAKKWQKALSQISLEERDEEQAEKRWRITTPTVKKAAKDICLFLRSREGKIAQKLLEKSNEVIVLQGDSGIYSHGYSVLLMTSEGICFQSCQSSMGAAMTGEKPDRRFLLTAEELEKAVWEIVEKKHHKPEWLLAHIKQEINKLIKKLTKRILKKKTANNK